jgi:hypothetical protein
LQLVGELVSVALNSWLYKKGKNKYLVWENMGIGLSE